ncbi:unnamed protein product [Bursaphelenchus xylophilus]|uniref:Major sperm protein n=1 Tax=Bursaphelenchus xylophilus TaxID=6326 RepID=A0A1I7RMK7_BURXY|nr:unnamed protein product [Bursaphelenchus xylophilus]CAG9125731.1 unnamed protein product [Bursaphelenchus xylophilus]
MSERNFQLNAQPRDKLIFSGDLNGETSATLHLTNRSDSRQAFKVKCTRNDIFKIRPAAGILDFGQSVDVIITFKPKSDYTPQSDRHHIGVYHIPAPEGSTCTGAWAEHYGPPQGEVRIKVFFEK